MVVSGIEDEHLWCRVMFGSVSGTLGILGVSRNTVGGASVDSALCVMSDVMAESLLPGVACLEIGEEPVSSLSLRLPILVQKSTSACAKDGKKLEASSTEVVECPARREVGLPVRLAGCAQQTVCRFLDDSHFAFVTNG